MIVDADVMNCILTGTIGHVAHGKSTVVKAISGVQVFLCLFLFCSGVGMRVLVCSYILDICNPLNMGFWNFVFTRNIFKYRLLM